MYPGGYEIQGGKTSALSQLVMERELMTRVIGHRLRTGKNVFVFYVRGQDKVGSRDDDPYRLALSLRYIEEWYDKLP